MINQIEDALKNFLRGVGENSINIYNEISLQHELGLFLRFAFKDKLTVEFERPVNHFGLNVSDFAKKEIDIVLYTQDKSSIYAIELKFPRNGQYPEQMFKACEDIMFLEQLKERGFKGGFFIMLADDPGFYSQKGETSGIYSYFRDGKILTGKIQKPTGKKDSEVNIKGKYKIYWNEINLGNNSNQFKGELKYFVVRV